MAAVWQEIVDSLRADFGDLADVTTATRVIGRLLLAALLGGLLGFTRELRGKEAGVRTHMLVAIGATLFILVPLQAGMAHEDLGRVVGGLVAGIGFLGAGAILKVKEEREIQGLTTAAGIWLTAAVGLCVGMGQAMTAIVTTIIAVLILSGLGAAEDKLKKD